MVEKGYKLTVVGEMAPRDWDAEIELELVDANAWIDSQALKTVPSL
jgi:hypothetical protein